MAHSPDLSLPSLPNDIAAAVLAPKSKELKQCLGEREVSCERHGVFRSLGTRYLDIRNIWTPCGKCRERSDIVRSVRHRQVARGDGYPAGGHANVQRAVHHLPGHDSQHS